MPALKELEVWHESWHIISPWNPAFFLFFFYLCFLLGLGPSFLCTHPLILYNSRLKLVTLIKKMLNSPIYSSIKNYWGINLIKEAQNLYIETKKHCWKKFKNTWISGKTVCVVDYKIWYCYDISACQIELLIQNNICQNLNDFFLEINNLILKAVYKFKLSRIVKTLLK